MKLNPNRLFPRLSITAKLAIAFVLLALVPLALVAWMGTTSTVRQMRWRATELLEHDLERVGERTALSLGELAEQVGYLGQLGIEEAVLREDAERLQTLESTVGAFLASDASGLFRAKVLDSTGAVVLRVDASGGRTRPYGESIEPLYLWTASELDAGQTRLVPVEMRGYEGSEVVPALAAVRAIRDQRGVLRGVVVGEARAAELFSGVDVASPGTTGITGIVDGEGRFLYHTTRKRDWATLLARRGEEGVRSDLPEAVATEVLSGRIGTVHSEIGTVTTFRPLSVPAVATPPVLLYRTFPQATVGASVRRYFAATAAVAALIVSAVLAIAVVAARQLTRPLRLLQDAARRVSGGASYEPLGIDTNDEIQDLADDFEIMAREVEGHRLRLEAAVEERTRSLHQAEEELSRIVSMSADAIIGLDRDGLVRHWNRGAERLFGYTAEETLKRDLDDLILPTGQRSEEESACLRRMVEEQGAVIAYQTVRRTKAGEGISVGLTHTRLTDESGETVGHSVIVRDHRLHEQQQESMRRSERLAAVSVVAAGLAHELNNPVAIIGNRIELMQREVPRSGEYDGIRKDLGVLHRHVNRLGAITGDLLRFAREETDVGRDVQVNEIVGRVVRLMDRVLAAQGVRLKHRLEANLPTIDASTSAVETTLVNLLLNAQDVSPPGATVTVETRSKAEHGRIEIEVRDTGSGVPVELRHRIFEPFFTTKAETGGTGLGLAVCRALMERQRGTIHLAPGNGRGAAFVLSFPVGSKELP